MFLGPDSSSGPGPTSFLSARDLCLCFFVFAVRVLLACESLSCEMEHGLSAYCLSLCVICSRCLTLCFPILYLAMYLLISLQLQISYPSSKSSRHQPFFPSQTYLAPAHGSYPRRFQHKHMAASLGTEPRIQRPSQTLQHRGRSLRRHETAAGTLGHLQRMHPLAPSQKRPRRDPRPEPIQPRRRLLRPSDPRPQDRQHRPPRRHRPLCKTDLPTQPTSWKSPSLLAGSLPAHTPRRAPSKKRPTAPPREGKP